MADQQQVQPGLAGALEQQPDLSAPPPQTPQEFEQRKSQWGDVLQKVQSDPNIMRAIAVAGIRMMQPGATFGQGIASGYGAWEAGNAAAEDSARQAQIDQQNAALRGAQTEAIQQQTAESAVRAPLELKQLQAAVDDIPDMKARSRAQAELDTFKAAEYIDTYPQRLEELRAKINAANASADASRAQASVEKTGGAAQQQFNNMFDTFLAEEQLKNPTANPAIQRANAMRATLNERYAQGPSVKVDADQEKAVALYLRFKDATDVQRLAANVDSSVFAYGEQLAKQRGLVPAGANDTGVKPIGATVNLVRDKNGKLVIQGN